MLDIGTKLLKDFGGLESVSYCTDKYFTKTSEIVKHFGDCEVTYAVFMRRPVLYAVDIALSWLRLMSKEKGIRLEIQENYKEGDWVGAGEPLFYYKGKFSSIVEFETLLLQKVGGSCIAAYNAYEMCSLLPEVTFSAMEARHCTGINMMELMAYGAYVGSEAAKSKHKAQGFKGTSNDITAGIFGQKEGLGTMPHALIGYAGSTVRAAEMYHTLYPEEDMTVLVDYFGREISDSISVCERFRELARGGRLTFRVDTHGGRFVEGLDTDKSYKVLDKHAPRVFRDLRKEQELRYLVGTGVSAAAIWYLREQLDEAGFTKVKIVASSGFTVEKCKVFALSGAPVNAIGTGSYLPENWLDTYTTADIVRYGDKVKVKKGREFLTRKLGEGF